MKNPFSERLKELRLENDLKQAELAKEVNISLSVISMYENGLRKPGMDAIIALSNYFKVTTDYILGLED